LDLKNYYRYYTATRDVASHCEAGKNILAGPNWGENFWILLFKTADSGVLYIFERRRGAQTSRGPG